MLLPSTPLLKKTLAIFTLCAVIAAASEAQQPIQLSKQSQSVKEKIAKLKVGDKISVVEIHAEEEYGTFKSSGEEDFTFYDVDQQHDVTLPYAEVKKVKNGYGGYNSATHRHTDRSRGYIVYGAITAVFVALLVAVVTAKN